MSSGDKKFDVVVGVDEGPHSQAAFQKALKFLKKEDAHFNIVNVRPETNFLDIDVEYPVGFSDYVEEVNALNKLKSEKVLKKYSDIASSAGVKFSVHDKQGDPRDELLNFCKTSKADVLVLGSRGTTFLSRMLLGSVSAYCVNHAPCAVFVDHSKVGDEAFPSKPGAGS